MEKIGLALESFYECPYVCHNTGICVDEFFDNLYYENALRHVLTFALSSIEMLEFGVLADGDTKL